MPGFDSRRRLQLDARMRRWVATAVLSFFLFHAVHGAGVNIDLHSGARFENVIITERTADSLTIQTEFGELTLPLDSVHSIDGRRLIEPTPAPAPPTAPPVPALETPSPQPTPVDADSQPEAVTPPEPETPADEPMPSPAEETESPAEPEKTEKTRSELDETQPDEPATDVEEATPPPETRPYAHHPKMDVVLGGVAALVLLWLWQLVWVQGHLNSRRRLAHGWNSIVLLVPGIGFLAYLGLNLFGKNPEPEPLPGGQSDFAEAAARKKSLFGSPDDSRPKGQGIGLRFIDDQNQPVPLQEYAGDKPTLENVREILETAVVARASDVHVEPQEEEWRVRIRVDGQLNRLQTLNLVEGKRLVTALKSLAEIDVAEKRKAQDGRFRVRTDLRDVDFRVATSSSIFGEKMVIRILDRKGGLFSLDQVGMTKEMEADFDQAIHSRAGMIIVTGPTGSGKTSTLYAALSRLDRARLNVMTIEDPVEYELEGATQIPVHPKAGVTYESGLRSILRQDPDVILVGEMRDAEAARVALRAALTGHLVFSSLHTRDTVSTLVRLEEMGLDRAQLSSALLMLVAQRLVRLLCTHCRKPVTSTGEELQSLGVKLPVGKLIHEPVGCEKCDGTGFRGRTAIFELLVMNDALRTAVAEGASEDTLYELARQSGYRNYREDGALKVLQGLTSAREVLEAS